MTVFTGAEVGQSLFFDIHHARLNGCGGEDSGANHGWTSIDTDQWRLVAEVEEVEFFRIIPRKAVYLWIKFGEKECGRALARPAVAPYPPCGVRIVRFTRDDLRSTICQSAGGMA